MQAGRVEAFLGSEVPDVASMIEEGDSLVCIDLFLCFTATLVEVPNFVLGILNIYRGSHSIFESATD
jgi:hypothetical protein